MSFDEIFDLTAGVYFNFYDILRVDMHVYDAHGIASRVMCTVVHGLHYLAKPIGQLTVDLPTEDMCYFCEQYDLSLS